MDEVTLSKLYQHIGSRVKLRRSILGLSQQDIANKLKISVHLLDDIERGAQRINAHTLLRYSKLTKVPLIWFFIDLSPIDGSGKPLEPANVIPILFDRTIKNSRQKRRNAA